MEYAVAMSCVEENGRKCNAMGEMRMRGFPPFKANSPGIRRIRRAHEATTYTRTNFGDRDMVSCRSIEMGGRRAGRTNRSKLGSMPSSSNICGQRIGRLTIAEQGTMM